MSLRLQATALIRRFLSDIDAIIREHAERATHLALKQHGLPQPRRAKRLRSVAPLELVAPSSKRANRKRRKPAKAEAAVRKPKKRRAKSKTPAEQLSLF